MKNILATTATFTAIALLSTSAALAGGQAWFVQDHRIDLQPIHYGQAHRDHQESKPKAVPQAQHRDTDKQETGSKAE